MGKVVTSMGITKKTAEHELKKHAATIHCSNSLSLLQRKISNALLYHAHKEMLLKEEHEISIKHLCKLIGYQGHNHAAIKDALKGLLSTVIEWNLVNDMTKTEDWTASSILASVSMQGPICLYAYSPRMKQLLHSPSMFGKINLIIQSRFKSSYGLALYENCIRYCGLPYTKWFEIEIFRKLMGVHSELYPIFRDFKRRVLDKSINEVNTYSDIFVEVELLKEGRRVVKVRFKIRERDKKTRIGTITSNSATEEDDTLRNKLLKLGITSEQTRNILHEYEPDYIFEKIKMMETSKNYQHGLINNIPGYLISALKKDYQKNSIQQKQQSQQFIQQSHCHDLKKEVENIQKKYLTYRDKIIDNFIEQLNHETRSQFLDRFYEYAELFIHSILTLQRKKYTRETVLESPQVKAYLRQFTLREMPNIQKKMLPLQKFIDTLPEKSRHYWQEFQRLSSPLMEET